MSCPRDVLSTQAADVDGLPAQENGMGKESEVNVVGVPRAGEVAALPLG